jgi:hypothetical protein
MIGEVHCWFQQIECYTNATRQLSHRLFPLLTLFSLSFVPEQGLSLLHRARPYHYSHFPPSCSLILFDSCHHTATLHTTHHTPARSLT